MGLLLLLMTIAGALAALGLLIVSIVQKKAWLRNFVLGALSVWSLFYVAILLGFSLSSEEMELGLNEPKEFCGFYLDCHMHAAVTAVRKTKTIGNYIAEGEFYIVTVKIFSNARQATLGLDAVDAHVVDSSGREYHRDQAAESSLAPQPEFETKISPVQSFEKEIVFDLPLDSRELRLDLSEGSALERTIEKFLVADEDSGFHKRRYFKLTAEIARDN